MPPETGKIAWHLITAELHTGMLTLAFASAIIRLVGTYVTADQPVWRGLVRLAEPTAYLAAIGGLLALIASIITGFTYTWPLEVQLTSSVVLNKIAITAFSTTFWLLFLVTRAVYGPRLWDHARLRWAYAALATGGFLTLMLAGSTGGHLAGKRSALDGILRGLLIVQDRGLGVVPDAMISQARADQRVEACLLVLGALGAPEQRQIQIDPQRPLGDDVPADAGGQLHRQARDRADIPFGEPGEEYQRRGPAVGLCQDAKVSRLHPVDRHAPFVAGNDPDERLHAAVEPAAGHQPQGGPAGKHPTGQGPVLKPGAHGVGGHRLPPRI